MVAVEERHVATVNKVKRRKAASVVVPGSMLIGLLVAVGIISRFWAWAERASTPAWARSAAPPSRARR